MLRLKLRDYQSEALDVIADTFWGENPQQSILLVAPCAAGKTAIASEAAVRLSENNFKSLIIAPYRSLIDQFVTTLIFNGFNGTKAMYEMVLARDPKFLDPRTKLVQELYDQKCKTKIWKPEIAYLASGKAKTVDYSNIKVVVAMSQTIESRGLPDVPFKVVHLDEAHLTWYRYELQARLQEYKYRDQLKLALYTATPLNHDGRKYGKNVKYHQVITTKELIERGYNCPFYYLVLGTMEAKLANKSDDLTQKQQMEVLDKICDPESSWDKLHNPHSYISSNLKLESVFKQRTVFFFSLKKTALQYMDYFREQMKEAGIDKELLLIHADTPDKERTESYLKFQNGEALLFNVMCLAIGFDEPSIENLVCFRPFSIAGLSNFIQIFGRLLRVYPGKTHGVFYDMCSNPQFVECLPDRITRWEIPENTDKYKREGGILPIPKNGKECEHCGTINGRGMVKCYVCGEELPKAKEKTIEEETDEIQAKLQAFVDNSGYFNINNQLLDSLQRQFLAITELCKDLTLDNQTLNSLSRCLLSIKSAIGGFVFKNNPLPIEKLQTQSYKLVELGEIVENYKPGILQEIYQFGKLVRSFLSDGEVEKAADKYLKSLKTKMSDGFKFIEISSSNGLDRKDVYRNLLKIAVLCKEFAPGWAYLQMKALYDDPKLDIPRDWKRHAIFGENPTYGNYLKYRYFLWSKFKGKANANKDVFSNLSDEFGRKCIEFNDQYIKDELAHSKAL